MICVHHRSLLYGYEHYEIPETLDAGAQAPFYELA